jgi:2-polyprenyl-3-methyl-5-hydroxy-6-metoxy-1,4-benzoquinol methylase
MPHSSGIGKAETVRWFILNKDKIKRVLDIGVGAGTYAKIIKIQKNLAKDAEWVGIEAWTPYIEKFELNNLYDQIINLDVRTVDWSSMGSFDVAIAGDVLEHMTKDEAVDLVEKVLDHATTMIISIPIWEYPQGAAHGNPFEVHVKEDWSHEEVKETWGKYIQKSFVGYYEEADGSLNSKLGIYWLSK